jgi:hypothetical protein
VWRIVVAGDTDENEVMWTIVNITFMNNMMLNGMNMQTHVNI